MVVTLEWFPVCPNYWYVVCCTHYYFLEVFRKYVMDHRKKEVLVLYRVFGAGIATGYRLYSPDSVPGSAEFLSSPQRTDRLWGSPSLYSMGTRGSLPGR
jgi:hypothetical protein